MGGNVRQWCEDLLDASHKARVLRGASWFDHDHDVLLSSYRISYGSHFRNSTCGFRCVVGASAR
jgi:formylglycine-generating enzyme required for sulfatase activity